jgi:hypothetical protein
VGTVVVVVDVVGAADDGGAVLGRAVAAVEALGGGMSLTGTTGTVTLVGGSAD